MVHEVFPRRLPLMCQCRRDHESCAQVGAWKKKKSEEKDFVCYCNVRCGGRGKGVGVAVVLSRSPAAPRSRAFGGRVGLHATFGPERGSFEANVTRVVVTRSLSQLADEKTHFCLWFCRNRRSTNFQTVSLSRQMVLADNFVTFNCFSNQTPPSTGVITQ